MMKIRGMVKMDEERISQRILYMIVMLSAIVFLVFYLIGYDTPFTGNVAFNAPVLTDVLFWFIWGLLAIATVASIITVVRGIRRANRSEEMANNIPAREIAYTTYGVTALILFLTSISGSTQTMMVNGENFTDSFWLRIADMFANNSLFLLALATGVAVLGVTHYYRKGYGK